MGVNGSYGRFTHVYVIPKFQQARLDLDKVAIICVPSAVLNTKHDCRVDKGFRARTNLFQLKCRWSSHNGPE